MTDKLSVADDWIEWNGGECPVDRETNVTILMRCETPSLYIAEIAKAGAYTWEHEGEESDIIAYRLARERGL